MSWGRGWGEKFDGECLNWKGADVNFAGGIGYKWGIFSEIRAMLSSIFKGGMRKRSPFAGGEGCKRDEFLEKFEGGVETDPNILKTYPPPSLRPSRLGIYIYNRFSFC